MTRSAVVVSLYMGTCTVTGGTHPSGVRGVTQRLRRHLRSGAEGGSMEVRAFQNRNCHAVANLSIAPSAKRKMQQVVSSSTRCSSSRRGSGEAAKVDADGRKSGRARPTPADVAPKPIGRCSAGSHHSHAWHEQYGHWCAAKARPHQWRHERAAESPTKLLLHEGGGGGGLGGLGGCGGDGGDGGGAGGSGGGAGGLGGLGGLGGAGGGEGGEGGGEGEGWAT